MFSRVQELHLSSKVVVCSRPTDISSPVPLDFYVTNLLFGKVPQAYNRPDRCGSSILRDPAWLDLIDDTLCADLRRPDMMSPRIRMLTEPPSIRSFTCDKYTNCVSLLLSELPWRRRDRRNSLLIMFNFLHQVLWSLKGDLVRTQYYLYKKPTQRQSKVMTI